MAEAMMIHKLKSTETEIRVDSAGTGHWHVGDWPDSRTLQILEKHGVPRASRARQVKPSDFTEFDYIVAMDQSNRMNLLQMKGAIPEKVSLMLDWAEVSQANQEVPDPYYGDASAFEDLYQMLDPVLDRFIVVINS
jgi:protein-tyrosine-phosphatase